MMNEIKRCTGHCCRRFNFPFSYEEMQRLRDSVNQGINHFTLDSGEEREHWFFDKEEINKIADMLIFIERTEMYPHNGDNINDVIPVEKREDIVKAKKGYVFDKQTGRLSMNVFTCKHFNQQSGDCMNYDNRPSMCRKYPYDRKCNYKECTCVRQEDIELCKSLKELETLDGIKK